jgi:hypothetical protein
MTNEELIAYLETDQLVKERSRAVGRAALSPRARVGLWALRVFTIVVGAMVIYTFISQLTG